MYKAASAAFCRLKQAQLQQTTLKQTLEHKHFENQQG